MRCVGVDKALELATSLQAPTARHVIRYNCPLPNSPWPPERVYSRVHEPVAIIRGQTSVGIRIPSLHPHPSTSAIGALAVSRLGPRISPSIDHRPSPS
jgi:hypothetical protein